MTYDFREPPYPLANAFRLFPIRPKTIGTYVLEHVSTGSVYIGSSGELRQRLMHHWHDLVRGVHFSLKMQNLFDSDKNFRVLTVDLFTNREDAYSEEQRLLDEYKIREGIEVININPDVRVSWRGVSLSEDAKARISASAKKQWENPEYKEWMRAKHIGRKRSPETVQRILDSRGVKRPSVEIDGVAYRTIHDAVKALGLTYLTIYHRCQSSSDIFSNWRICGYH